MCWPVPSFLSIPHLPGLRAPGRAPTVYSGVTHGASTLTSSPTAEPQPPPRSPSLLLQTVWNQGAGMLLSQGTWRDRGQLITCVHIEADALCHVSCCIGEGARCCPGCSSPCFALAQFTGGADRCGYGGGSEAVRADGGSGNQE